MPSPFFNKKRGVKLSLPPRIDNALPGGVINCMDPRKGCQKTLFGGSLHK